jgi:hypothetical protein
MLGLVSAESVHHFVRSSLGPLTMFDESGLTPRLSGELCVSLFRRLSNPLNVDSGTCYGISAALGKTGAAVGTQAFTPIQIHLGKK